MHIVTKNLKYSYVEFKVARGHQYQKFGKWRLVTLWGRICLFLRHFGQAWQTK